MSSPEQHGGYEKADINVNKVILFFVLGVIAIVIILVFLLDYFKTVRNDTIYDEVLKPQSTTLRELHARENEGLTTYKLLDADKGIYRIQIERAKKLLADEAYRERNK